MEQVIEDLKGQIDDLEKKLDYVKSEGIKTEQEWKERYEDMEDTLRREIRDRESRYEALLESNEMAFYDSYQNE